MHSKPLTGNALRAEKNITMTEGLPPKLKPFEVIRRTGSWGFFLAAVAAGLHIFFSGCSAIRSTSFGASSEDPTLAGAIRFYEGPLDHLSTVRTGKCPMHPSCSAYAMQAIRKHGPLIGWIMACDRLMRCGRDEIDLSNKVLIDGKWKTYDTVAANDWWWSGREQNEKQIRIQNLRLSTDWKISIQ
jgi:putative component of membrane protein insertase Oxa1/YidC/SpoIIIJ protein YidD